MLVIDDNMVRLAKMQEALLRSSNKNREKNLSDYKNTVISIDAMAYASILNELENLRKHNHTLDEEVEFLKRVKAAYEELFKLQIGYKQVCELYGDKLVLSPLSKLNIDYVEKRINAIEGWKENLENIENNKKKLEELNVQLGLEEKKKASLSKKLLELEETLRNNFLNAEGRVIDGGQLRYLSVVSEYKTLGYDFLTLLNSPSELESLLVISERKKNEVREKLEAAAICYNNRPSFENKQIYSDISKDFDNVSYKHTMLMIIELLSKNCDSYDSFKEKRGKLIELINDRLTYLQQLGVQVSSDLDPFKRTKISEQLDVVSSFANVAQTLRDIRSEINDLTSRTEDMIKQNYDYLIDLSETRELFEDKYDSNKDVSFADISSFGTTQVALNQVIRVRNIASINMAIAKQKTAGVINRVNQMMNGVTEVVPDKEKTTTDDVVPDLVLERVVNSIPFEDTKDDVASKIVVPVENKASYLNDLFETVIPFEAPPMFSDKVDVVEKRAVPSLVEKPVVGTNLEEEKFPLAEMEESDLDKMPDVFWNVEQIDSNYSEEEPVVSFDEQIKALLGTGEESSKVKKLVA